MIVLDTRTLVWWVNGEAEALSARARTAIEAELEGGRILVSSISAWELGMLVARGRLALSMDVSEWLAVIGQIDSVSFVPVDNELAVRSAQLPGEFHTDPADRRIGSSSPRRAGTRCPSSRPTRRSGTIRTSAASGNRRAVLLR